jgi:hypothetical protein
MTCVSWPSPPGSATATCPCCCRAAAGAGGSADTAAWRLESPGPVSRVEVLSGPTGPVSRHPKGDVGWSLVNAAAADHLSLTEGPPEQAAAALRDTLRLYGPPQDDGWARQLEGIRSLDVAAHRAPAALRRAAELRPRAVDHARGRRAGLPGRQRLPAGLRARTLLARHAAINSFTELTLRSLQRGVDQGAGHCARRLGADRMSAAPGAAQAGPVSDGSGAGGVGASGAIDAGPGAPEPKIDTLREAFDALLVDVTKRALGVRLLRIDAPGRSPVTRSAPRTGRAALSARAGSAWRLGTGARAGLRAGRPGPPSTAPVAGVRRAWACGFFGLLGPQGPMPLHLTEFVRERLHQHGDPAAGALPRRLSPPAC